MFAIAGKDSCPRPPFPYFLLLLPWLGVSSEEMTFAPGGSSKAESGAVTCRQLEKVILQTSPSPLRTLISFVRNHWVPNGEYWNSQ